MSGRSESALVFMQFVTDNKIRDKRSRIATVLVKLGHLQKAGEIQASIEDKADLDYYTLGRINEKHGKYKASKTETLDLCQRKPFLAMRQGGILF